MSTLNQICDRISNETNWFINDKAHYFKQLITNPKEYLSWKDVERCINSFYFYNIQIIDKSGNEIQIPPTDPKKFVFKNFYEGATLLINNYGLYSLNTMELMNIFETLFEVNSDIHVYCGLEGSNSFPVHEDNPNNFIIQVEGKTRWKVFENRLSSLYVTGKMFNNLKEENLNLAIDVELEPGDVLYIPARTYHCAYPTEKRLSMSIPCWPVDQHHPNARKFDRSYYKLNF